MAFDEVQYDGVSIDDAKAARDTSHLIFTCLYEVLKKEAYIDLGGLEYGARVKLLKDPATDFYAYDEDAAWRKVSGLVVQALRVQATRNLAEFLSKRLWEMGVGRQVELDEDKFYILAGREV